MYGLPGALPATGMGALTILLGLAGFALILLGALMVRATTARHRDDRTAEQEGASSSSRHRAEVRS